MKKLICIVLSLLLLSACSFSEKVTDDPERTGGRFRDYTNAPLNTLNMYTTSDTVSINLSRLCTLRLYTKLINQDGDGYFYAPDLALSSPVSISDDNTVWQISLRKDCRWANGEIITAQDFVYSMHALLDPESANRQASVLSSSAYAPIKNAYEYNTGACSAGEVGIEATDDCTLRITCTLPVTADKLMRLFETPYTMVVYKPLYEASRIETGGSAYGTSAETFMSAGPMILTRWEKDALYCFDRNPDYVYADRYSIDGVDVSVVPDSNTATELFLSGQLDYLSISYSQWENFEDDPRVYDFWGNSLQYMFVNLGNPNQQNLLGDIDFRRALYYGAQRTSLSAALGAIPATRLVRKAVVGDPATGTPFVELEGAGDYVDDGYTVYNPNLAKEYLDRALEKRGIKEADMEIYYGESATHSRAASEILHAQYSSLFEGKLTVTLRSVPAAMQYNLRRYNPDDPTAFDTSIGSITPSADAPHYTFQYYVSSYSPPRFCYSNAEYDRLYAEAVSESDPIKSARICMQLEQILLSDLVIIPLYELPSKALFSSRVQLPTDGFINNFGFGYEFCTLVE
ncbi:MAG: hypothetical protein IJE90_06785 [Clostridia bacterium]|nr:hypothetical protein [Clostridia bacterium]